MGHTGAFLCILCLHDIHIFIGGPFVDRDIIGKIFGCGGGGNMMVDIGGCDISFGCFGSDGLGMSVGLGVDFRLSFWVTSFSG